MPRVPVVTKLSITEFAQVIGINPLHLWQCQVSNATVNTQRGQCQQAWFQENWQDVDRVGRSDLARAIREAEDAIETYLGFRLMPAWEADEWQETIRPWNRSLVNIGGYDLQGRPLFVVPRWQYLIAPGIRGATAIDAAAAIVYSDGDADGYAETATIAIATTVTDPCELRVYYPGHGGDDLWEIRPVSATIAGGIATITFRRELCVLQALYDAINPVAVNGLTNASFITTAAVWRVYNDTTTQATMVWEPSGVCDICGSGTTCGCTYSVQTACLYRTGDQRLGMWRYQPANYTNGAWSYGDTSCFARDPDAVRLYYLAGWQGAGLTCSRRELDSRWKRIIATFAASKLDRKPCDGNPDWWGRMAEDLAFSSGAEELASYNLSASDLANPFGTRRGAVEAWKAVSRMDLAVNKAGVTVR